MGGREEASLTGPGRKFDFTPSAVREAFEGSEEMRIPRPAG